MQHSEHLLAVLEPNETGEASLEIATDHVARGGKATLLIVLNQQVREDFRRFADAENRHVYNGEAVALDRLVNTYTSRVGGEDTEAIVTDSTNSARDLLHVAAESRATSIVIPQRLAARRGLRRLVTNSTVPVLIAPAA
jgi:hypothetical protein